MLEIVLTPTILGPHEIGGPRLKPFCLMINPRLQQAHNRLPEKQTRTMRIRENINLTNDDVMKYIIGTLQ